MMERNTCKIVMPVNKQEHSMGSGWGKESCLSLSRKPQQNGPEKALWEAQHIQLWQAAYFKRFSSVSFGLGFQENSYCCMDRHAYEARVSFYVCSWGLTWANVWFVSLCFPSKKKKSVQTEVKEETLSIPILEEEFPQCQKNHSEIV